MAWRKSPQPLVDLFDHALADHGARPFELRGRRMREYVILPDALLRDRAALAAWLARSIRYVRSLPPKPPRAARARPSTNSTRTTR